MTLLGGTYLYRYYEGVPLPLPKATIEQREGLLIG